MITMHGMEQPYHCDICEKKFLLKWRMIKHKKIHTENSHRACHYFNNKKECPYEEIGCKYLHADADRCKFLDKCNRYMCPFKH